jgi:epoxide hydrolase 4
VAAVSSELRHGYAQLPEARLHYVEAGEGPLVVLLHGFPEFWFSWRRQIPALAEAGFRVVAPDLRGYNLSSKPLRVRDYAIERAAADIAALIRERGAERAHVAGHDWGGATAWALAMGHPGLLDRLAILNMPHPRRMLEGFQTASQLRKSWYVFMLQAPWLPQRLLPRGDWRGLRRPFEQDARPGAFTPADIERYIEAWSRPGGMTGAINYYRAAFRRPPGRALGTQRPVHNPTMIIAGERDAHLDARLFEPHREDVPGLERVERLPRSSHWVQNDEPTRVSELLVEFFGGAYGAAAERP